jgi:hypothetical protein
MLTHTLRQNRAELLLKRRQLEKKPKPSALVQKMDSGWALADSINMSLIFLLKQYFAEALAGLGHMLMFPFAALASLIRASFAFYQAKKEGYKKRSVVQALVEGVTALAITAAVLGSLIAATLFATVAPIIFTAVSAVKTLYHLGAAFYYGVKAFSTEEVNKNEKYKNRAVAFGVGSFINALATVAIGLVMVAGNVSLGLLGMGAGMIGVIYTTYQIVKGQKKTSQAAVKSEENQDLLSSTGELYKAWGLKRSQSDTQLHARKDKESHLPASGAKLELRAVNHSVVADEPKVSRRYSF